MKTHLEILESSEFGLTVRVFERELADQLDDYLTETHYVPHDVAFGAAWVDLYLGQACDLNKVETMLAEFCRPRGLQIRARS